MFYNQINIGLIFFTERSCNIMVKIEITIHLQQPESGRFLSFLFSSLFVLVRETYFIRAAS